MHRLVLFVSLVVVAGCSRGHGTAAVSGTVLYKSQPVDGATINFLPQAEQPTAKPAHGKSDASGRFTLTTYFGPDDQPAGAMPGDYKVTITKIDEPQGAYDPNKDAPLKNHLPLKYGTPQQSPLTASVKVGPNRLEFKLED